MAASACAGYLSGGFLKSGTSRGLEWSSADVGVGGATLGGGFRLRRLRGKELVVLRVRANGQNLPQNVDFPAIFPKKKKKPFVTPLKQQKKNRRPPPAGEWTVRAPADGMLVQRLVPVAHAVIRAKGICERGVARLVDNIPVKTCRFCTEVHIGPVGHNLGTCRGPGSNGRKGLHDWLKGSIDDIIVPVEAYHLEDRLGQPISHDKRFDVDRISAVEELCIQAGVDNPRYPTVRYSAPVIPKFRKKVEDASWPGDASDISYTIKENNPKKSAHPLDDTGWTEVSMQETISEVVEDVETSIEIKYDEDTESEALACESNSSFGAELLEICAEDDLESVAEKTLIAWEIMRQGSRRLMTKYRVVACGYCPEVHVGPRGHRARNCGAFKHQWRDGKHGWQDAAMDELIPSQYVWHLRDKNGPPLEGALKRFYGKAPALVELCVQAGAAIPEKYKPLMRLDIAIPTMEEVELVV
ncbi:hypothetical protein Mapa_006881 [Marchantia paleacea]|nr:hypothetical protein Mapa_006881 [Marchantia paleacea]